MCHRKPAVRELTTQHAFYHRCELVPLDRMIPCWISLPG
jgi:hypothetical protein